MFVKSTLHTRKILITGHFLLALSRFFYCKSPINCHHWVTRVGKGSLSICFGTGIAFTPVGSGPCLRDGRARGSRRQRTDQRLRAAPHHRWPTPRCCGRTGSGKQTVHRPITRWGLESSGRAAGRFCPCWSYIFVIQYANGSRERRCVQRTSCFWVATRVLRPAVGTAHYLERNN